jgi:hypothetical protein
MTPRRLRPQILCAILKNSCSDCKASKGNFNPVLLFFNTGDLATVPFNTTSNRSCKRVNTVAPGFIRNGRRGLTPTTRVIQAIVQWWQFRRFCWSSYRTLKGMSQRRYLEDIAVGEVNTTLKLQ